MTDMIRTWWPVAVTVIAAIAWLIRLEARSISNGAEIRRLWSQRREDMEAAKDSRDRMDRRLDEIGSDIKEILKGMGQGANLPRNSNMAGAHGHRQRSRLGAHKPKH